MDKKRQSYAELRVGIFVIAACTILALAIFTIGTQVGLFEPTFLAKTYLNNVSGLKPGDIVLLAGVEAGNVTDVAVSQAGALPQTQANVHNLKLMEELSAKKTSVESEVADAEARLKQVNTDHQAALKRYPPQSREVRLLERQQNNLQTIIDDQRARLEELDEDIGKARSSLQNIAVYMEIKEQYRDWVRIDSNITLGSIGLLGDKYIDVALGRSPTAPPVLQEERKTWLGTRELAEVVLITGTQQAGFQELITGADDVIANFEVLSRKLQNIMDSFERGEGTVGKFFSDPSFYNNLNEAVGGAKESMEEATHLLRTITEGPGTVPHLIQQREVYDKINAAVGHLEQVMAQIEGGNGTLGKFVNDPSLYQKSDQVMENIRTITDRMETGQGTLGKLSTDEQLYVDLRRSVDQLASFLEDVEQGKGTLGRLAKDEHLYQNLNQLSSEIMKLIYDFRQNPKKFLTIKFELF